MTYSLIAIETIAALAIIVPPPDEIRFEKIRETRSHAVHRSIHAGDVDRTEVAGC